MDTLPRHSPRSLFRGGVALLLLYLFCLRELSGVTSAILLGFAGVVFAVVLDLPTMWLAKRMPRPVAVIVMLLVLTALAFASARVVIPVLARQFAVLGSQVPAGAERLWAGLRSSPTMARALPVKIDLSRIGVSVFGQFLPFLSGALAVLGGLGIVVTIAAFLCADPESDLRTLDALTPARYRERVHQVVTRSAAGLKRWIGGSLLLSLVVAVLTSVGLLAVGVHGWLALGLLTLAGGMVPHIGPAVVGVAIATAGLADSPRRALAAIGVYAVVEVLFGTVLSPLVSRATLRTSPTLLLIFQCIMAASFGVLGVLLAQPLLMVAIVILETVNSEQAGSTSS